MCVCVHKRNLWQFYIDDEAGLLIPVHAALLGIGIKTLSNNSVDIELEVFEVFI